MTVKLTKSEKVHPKLSSILVSLFVKNPSLMFKEVDYCYVDGVRACDEFRVYFNADEVGKIFYRDNKLHVRSPLISNERRPYNDFRTKSEKAALRKALEVFEPKGAGDVAHKVILQTKESLDSLKYAVNRKLPHIDSQELVAFFREYKFSDTKVPIPASIDAKLTDSVIQAIDEYHIVTELHNLVRDKKGYALREDVNGGMTIINLLDESIFYRGNSTYDLPVWMQSKVTILKLLEKNQAARNIGCKTECDGYTYYFIVDGEIPDLIE
jgi:hypothetical protein